MIAVFLTPEAYPFSIALCVVLGLFILELISLILGGSLLAIGSDAPDIDIDLDADFDIDIDADVDVETDLTGPGDIAPSGLLGWLGITEVPFLIWLVSFLTIFGLTGLVILSAGQAIAGLAIPLAISAPLAIIAAAYCARFIARVVAAIMPKTESSAMKTRFLGGTTG